MIVLSCFWVIALREESLFFAGPSVAESIAGALRRQGHACLPRCWFNLLFFLFLKTSRVLKEIKSVTKKKNVFRLSSTSFS